MVAYKEFSDCAAKAIVDFVDSVPSDVRDQIERALGLGASIEAGFSLSSFGGPCVYFDLMVGGSRKRVATIRPDSQSIQ